MRKLLFTAALIAVCAALAQARPTLGVLPFTGGAGDEGDVIASLFLGQRELLNAFSVVPRNMAMAAIFAERNIQLSDLTDPATVASVNRMLNADYVLSGSITRVGDRNLLIASIIHVESFEQVAGYFVTYRNIEEILGLLPSMSGGMAAAAQRQRAARAPSLAVIPFAHRAGVSAQDAETLAQLLAIGILNTGRYAVVPRLSIIQAALREQGFQMMGYTDNAGMASLGRAMNADFVLGGSITGLGATNLFISQILSVEGGSVAASENVQYQAIADGIELMGELAILLAYPPGAQRDRRIAELRAAHQHAALVPVPGANIVEQLAWLRANAASGTSYLIEMRGNAEIGPQTLALPEGVGNVTVILRGIGAVRQISLTTDSSELFVVRAGVTLVLDNNITLQGGRSFSIFPTVWVANGGTLIMNTGSTLTRGGLGVRVSGTFIMHGGAITNNSSATAWEVTRASGVEISQGGTFTMYGGTISNNRGAHGGGTGGVDNAGTFTMHGGTISGNEGGDGWNAGTGLSGGAGGVGGVANSGTFIRLGGTISSNIGGIGGQGNTARGGINGSRGADNIGSNYW